MHTSIIIARVVMSWVVKLGIDSQGVRVHRGVFDEMHGPRTVSRLRIKCCSFGLTEIFRSS